MRFQPFQEPLQKSCQALLTKAQVLADYANMSLIEALNTPMTICEMYFSSELWHERKQDIEKKMKLKAEMMGDIKACMKLLEHLLKRPY